MLGSDHAPHTREEKEHAYPDSHSGMTGVQTLVPIMLDHVNAGRLTLERFVDLTEPRPQRLFGIRGKGRIAVGYDADLTIVDLKRRETITNGWIQSRCGWTPYDGVSVQGWPVGTILRGRRVMWEGEICRAGRGPARALSLGCLRQPRSGPEGLGAASRARARLPGMQGEGGDSRGSAVAVAFAAGATCSPTIRSRSGGNLRTTVTTVPTSTRLAKSTTWPLSMRKQPEEAARPIERASLVPWMR